jgi:hypothetical protein
MKQKLKILAICLAVFTFIVTAALRSPVTDAQTNQVETAAQRFKNIKVLNDMPADQLGKVMNMMSASLGVNCAFCHASNDQDFEKEGFEHKDTARKMIKMVFDLNKSQFGGRPEINCNSCHNGKSHPQPSFPLTPVTVSDARPKQPEKKPTVDEILTKLETALGGRAILEKMSSRQVTAIRMEHDGKTSEPETKWFKGNKYYAETVYGKTVVAEGFDGTKAWKSANKIAIDLKPDEAEQLKREAELFSPANIKSVYPKMEFRSLEKIDGREVYLVTATTAGNVRERLYFDIQSGLLVRRTASTPTVFGNYVYQVDYSDYKMFNGVNIATKVRYAMPNISWTTKVVDIRNNVHIEDNRFALPAAGN